MSLFIASLNSGSNGNCYYIGNEREAVLVDAGISCRETEKRMKRIGLSMEKVKAIFISHEHSDHIRGIEVIAKKYQLPVYGTPATMQRAGLMLQEWLIYDLKAHHPVRVGDLRVTAFPKQHDAIDPHSFIVEGNGVTIGVFTDIGAPCRHVETHFSRCHAAFLESNYDEAMLENGAYPVYLKNRIRGDEGHLSNVQALQLFHAHRPEFMSLVLLSHLSRDNNSPQVAQSLFEAHAGNVHVTVASRNEESSVYHVKAEGNDYTAAGPAQLSLFR